MADCMLAPAVHFARAAGAPILAYPRIVAIALRCATEPAFASAAPFAGLSDSSASTLIDARPPIDDSTP
jgi:glutathione S-transferase